LQRKQREANEANKLEKQRIAELEKQRIAELEKQLYNTIFYITIPKYDIEVLQKNKLTKLLDTFNKKHGNIFVFEPMSVRNLSIIKFKITCHKRQSGKIIDELKKIVGDEMGTDGHVNAYPLYSPNGGTRRTHHMHRKHRTHRKNPTRTRRSK
jgi:hypothetical protein